MPLKRCKEKGQSGWKWGNEGKCYVGKDAKKKALKQGVAIEGPEKFKKVMGSEDADLVREALQEHAAETSSYTDDLIENVKASLKGEDRE